MKTRFTLNVTLGIVALIAFMLFGLFKSVNRGCKNSFGVEFNARRKQLNIPALPPDWPVFYEGEKCTTWQQPKGKKGHGFKIMVYDGCEPDGELDHYYFSPKRLQDTVLTMDHRYKNTHRKTDSAIFTFQTGDHVDTITRQKAESILTANKIDRDY